MKFLGVKRDKNNKITYALVERYGKIQLIENNITYNHGHEIISISPDIIPILLSMLQGDYDNFSLDEVLPIAKSLNDYNPIK